MSKKLINIFCISAGLGVINCAFMNAAASSRPESVFSSYYSIHVPAFMNALEEDLRKGDKNCTDALRYVEDNHVFSDFTLKLYPSNCGDYEEFVIGEATLRTKISCTWHPISLLYACIHRLDTHKNTLEVIANYFKLSIVRATNQQHLFTLAALFYFLTRYQNLMDSKAREEVAKIIPHYITSSYDVEECKKQIATDDTLSTFLDENTEINDILIEAFVPYEEMSIEDAGYSLLFDYPVANDINFLLSPRTTTKHIPSSPPDTAHTQNDVLCGRATPPPACLQPAIALTKDLRWLDGANEESITRVLIEFYQFKKNLNQISRLPEDQHPALMKKYLSNKFLNLEKEPKVRLLALLMMLFVIEEEFNRNHLTAASYIILYNRLMNHTTLNQCKQLFHRYAERLNFRPPKTISTDRLASKADLTIKGQWILAIEELSAARDKRSR